MFRCLCRVSVWVRARAMTQDRLTCLCVQGGSQLCDVCSEGCVLQACLKAMSGHRLAVKQSGVCC